MESKEEFNEDYLYVHWAGNQKKQDKKIVETKVVMSDSEVKQFLEKNLTAKKPYFTIKSELMDNGVTESVIEGIFIEVLKDIQKKKVDDLRKQGKFTPDMSKEQKAKFDKENEDKKAADKPAAAPGKKDAKKK